MRINLFYHSDAQIKEWLNRMPYQFYFLTFNNDFVLYPENIKDVEKFIKLKSHLIKNKIIYQYGFEKQESVTTSKLNKIQKISISSNFKRIVDINLMDSLIKFQNKETDTKNSNQNFETNRRGSEQIEQMETEDIVEPQTDQINNENFSNLDALETTLKPEQFATNSNINKAPRDSNSDKKQWCENLFSVFDNLKLNNEYTEATNNLLMELNEKNPIIDGCFSIFPLITFFPCYERYNLYKNYLYLYKTGTFRSKNELSRKFFALIENTNVGMEQYYLANWFNYKWRLFSIILYYLTGSFDYTSAKNQVSAQSLVGLHYNYAQALKIWKEDIFVNQTVESQNFYVKSNVIRLEDSHFIFGLYNNEIVYKQILTNQIAIGVYLDEEKDNNEKFMDFESNKKSFIKGVFKKEPIDIEEITGSRAENTNFTNKFAELVNNHYKQNNANFENASWKNLAEEFKKPLFNVDLAFQDVSKIYIISKETADFIADFEANKENEEPE